MPSPDKSVSIEEIIKFREHHKDQFKNFLHLINKYSLQFSSLESPEHVKEVLDLFNEEIDAGKRDLARSLQENKIKVCWQSLGLLTVGNPIIWSLAGFRLTELPKLFNLTGAILSATVLIAGLNAVRYFDRRNIIKENPFAYLLKAENRGMIPII